MCGGCLYSWSCTVVATWWLVASMILMKGSWLCPWSWCTVIGDVHDPGAWWLVPICGTGVWCRYWKQRGGLRKGSSVEREVQAIVMLRRERQKKVCPNATDEVPTPGCLSSKCIWWDPSSTIPVGAAEEKGFFSTKGTWGNKHFFLLLEQVWFVMN